ncbi:MAG: hypothetical protein DRI39_00980 [Chloroflexi bacterium]|nr:MAG: hypothetical protein DRI39_00980 [Chloroflexota bacterium]
MRFDRAATVDASPETVWMAVNDPEQWPSWVPSIREVKKVSDGPLAVGSQFRIRVKAILPVTLHMTVIEFVPKRRVVMQGRVLCTRLTRYYTLEPAGSGARITAGGEASGVLAWLVCRNGRKLSEDIVQGLKKRVEGLRVS